MMNDNTIIESLSIGLLIYNIDLRLRQQNPAAVAMFGLEIGSYFPDSFDEQLIKGAIRRLQRGQTPTFTLQNRNGVQIECSTTRTDTHIIVQAYENHSLKETQVLLNNYSIQLEQQNFDKNRLLDEANWLRQAFAQSVRPMFMVDTGFRIRFMNDLGKSLLIKHFRTLFKIIPEVFQEEIIGADISNLPVFTDIPENIRTPVVITMTIETVTFECRLATILQADEVVGYCVEIQGLP